MKKLILVILCIFLLVTLLLPAVAEAGGWGDTVKGFVKDLVMDKLLSYGGIGGGIAALILGKLIKDGRKVKRAMKETGEFFRVVGTSMEDGSISGKDIGRILKEGKDVIDLCRKTPTKYKG